MEVIGSRSFVSWFNFSHLGDLFHLLICGLGHPFTAYRQDIPVYQFTGLLKTQLRNL